MTLIDRYDGFVFDLDGTIYLGDSLLPGAADVIDAVRRAGKPLLYLTNKPLEPSAAYAAKLTRLGLATSSQEVVSSLDALVVYLDTHHAGRDILCVSEPLVAETLARAGHRIVPLSAPERAAVVVVSFDRTFDYQKLHAAYRAVRAGAVIVATNPDRYCPTPDGGLPDCAAMLAAIEACTGVAAEAITGKPHSPMANVLLQRLGIPPEGVLLSGDRLETDVVMAARAGMDSALVLTGATGRDEVESTGPPPTHIFDRLEELLDLPQPLEQTRPL